MKTHLWSVITGAVVLLVSGILISITREDLLMAGGSKLVNIYCPPLWSQTLAMVLLVISIGLTAKLAVSKRVVVIIVTTVAFAMSVHCITISSDDLREMWSIFVIRSLPLDENIPARISDQGVFFMHYEDGVRTATIFLGVYPWRLDAMEISRDPLLNLPPGP